jgi:hypothetical protein
MTSNIVEIHCEDFAEKAVVLAYLKHLPDIYKQYQSVEDFEDYRDIKGELATKVFLNKKL